MAWQTPKTNWAAADGVRNTDFNRIEGNTLELYRLLNLTGVYQEPTFSTSQLSSVSMTTDPIPSSWIQVINGTEYVSGDYRIKASSYNAAGMEAFNAFKGTMASTAYWRSASDTTHSLQVTLPVEIIINKVRFCYSVSGAGALKIQSSADGVTWTDEYSAAPHPSTILTVDLPNAPRTKYLRMLFTSKASTTLTVFGFQIVDYVTYTYKAAFTLSNMPTLIAGQKILIQVPTSYASSGVTQNTLNNVTITSLLRAGKKYELIYYQSGYTAMEVA